MPIIILIILMHYLLTVINLTKNNIYEKNYPYDDCSNDIFRSVYESTNN